MASFPDLSSNFIPVDDDEEEVEEEEETYDDIERATTPPSSRPGPASVPTPSKRQPPQSSREEWEDQAGTHEDEEEEEDIYEVLPGKEKIYNISLIQTGHFFLKTYNFNIDDNNSLTSSSLFKVGFFSGEKLV